MNVRQDLVAVENKIDAVLETVNDTKEEIGDVKSEVRGLKGDLGEVKSEVQGLKNDLGEVKSEMSAQTKLISQLPTREELATLLNMKQQLDRVREIIRERLKVEV